MTGISFSLYKILQKISAGRNTGHRQAWQVECGRDAIRYLEERHARGRLVL